MAATTRALALLISLGVGACDHGDAPPTPTPTPAPPAPMPAPAIARPSPTPAPQIVIAKDRHGPTRVVVTPTDIVWIDEIAGTLSKVSKAGGPIVELANSQVTPLDVVSDGTTVFWTTGGDSGSMTDPQPAGGVWSVPLAGGPITALATRRPSPGAIALDDASVYFAEAGLVDDKGASVSKVARRGGAVMLLHGPEAHPGGVALDATHLYWSTGGTCVSVGGAPEPADGSISSMDLVHGTRKVLATGLRCPETIALDDDAIYVCDMSDGTILRVAKTGGGASVVATDDAHGTRYVAVDATTIYWANQVTGKIRRQAKAGGPIETLAVMKDPQSIVVDDQFVYFTDADAGVVVKIAK